MGGYVVLVALGVVVVGAALGVGLVAVVLHGIKGEHAQWPVTPDARNAPHGVAITGDAPRAGIRGGTGPVEHPEWTGREMAGEDMRPVGSHEEKHAFPGRARWW